MEDFFNQFRDNLERRPLPLFEEQDWRDLEKRLGHQDKKRPAVLAWWWLAWPLLMLSLGANVLLYKELSAPQQKNVASKVERDTVFQTRVMYKTDTIYRTRIVQPQLSESLKPSESSSLHRGLSLCASDTITQVRTPLEPIQQVNKSVVYEPVFAQLSENPSQPSGNLSALPPLQPSILCPPPSTPILPEISVDLLPPKQAKTLQQHLYSVRPKRYYLGIAGGWAYPVSKDLGRQGGLSAGLEADIEFSPALRMWMGATYTNTRLVTNRMDETIGIPPVDPPSDDFIFVEAEASQPALEYGVGMQYTFNTSKKIKPFLGVGYGAVSLLPYEVVYDFENKPLGIEWSFEKNVDRGEFLTNMLLLRAGFEYDISKNWNWHLRATYRTDFDKTGFQSPDMLGIQTGLMRRF